MVIYADVLIVLNVIVDYFLIKLTALFAAKSPSNLRLILGSLLGGLSSLYIFLPPLHFLLEFLLRFILSLLISLVVFGYGSKKKLMGLSALFFVVTFAYAGAMLGVWYLFKPKGMAINNSVVYFNVSPVILIVLSVIFYFSAMLFKYLFERRHPPSKECELEICLGKKSAKGKALVDTGNSLSDAFGLSQVIIVDKDFAEGLLSTLTSKEGEEEMVSRYRVLPCNTVSGKTLLDGYRCDKAYIKYGGNETKINRPIIALSKTPIAGDCVAIINPRSV